MFLKKTRRNREEARLSLVRNEHIYQAIKEEHEEHNYPIGTLCKLGHISRAAYYKWLHRDIPSYEAENERIAVEIEKIHMDSPDKGYRRIRDDLERYSGIKANDKRILRICRKKGIKSTIKYSNNGCTRQAANPQFIAENVLNREFSAEAPNHKWLTDVTEFKYYIGIEVHKIYLSAILDLFDRRIVSFVIRDSNNNALVFDTFDAAIAANPGATPLCHSDRGFQYTNRAFHAKLEAAGMTQSMSRVAKCIDNGPMEGFWGILKRERYYGNRFTDRDTLVKMIEDYIEYYNTRRLQRKLGILTPFEKYEQYLAVA
ncbi:IS3 family transposase [Butyrivibrio fibrisolvens]|uniref:IS3 family transposase n=6 Tax=Butyrivibrio TaxID=830 RepID=UPI002E8E54B6|nr:IS3 family transposase [Butyrivibrio fibrisolvens]